MHNIDLILTLAGGLAAALACGYVTHRIGLSPIVGYLLAGVLVGPHTPGLEVDRHLAEQLAEVGVILLMFGVGLHFHVEELLAVRRVAIPGAVGQSLVATGLGALVAVAFGFDWTAGLVFGLALSVASTVVLTRVLADNRDLHTPTGHIAVGWLVVEDLFTVIVLVLLPILFGGKGGGGFGAVLLGLLLAGLKVAALVAFTFLAGGRIIPWLLERMVATRSRELFTLTILVIVLGIAVGSTQLFGVSMALGAFLAGMVVGRSEFSSRAASEALPMRDAFAVLFFVSVGMLADPRFPFEQPWLTLATLGVIMLGKPLAALAIVLGLGYPPKVGFAVAVALAQIGEFSFILAALGKELNLLGDVVTNALVAGAIVSITLNPLIYRLIDPAEAWARRRPKLWAWLNSRVTQTIEAESQQDGAAEHRAVVVGYGPVGQSLVRLLRENDILPTIIEMNLDTVRKVREQGMPAVYGDARQRETLKEAGMGNAGSLILSSAGLQGTADIVRVARDLNPAVRVLARAAYVREMQGLRQAGADRIFSGEGEVALAFTEALLQELGATPEQIDRERERVREELFGPPTASDNPPHPDAAPLRPKTEVKVGNGERKNGQS